VHVRRGEDGEALEEDDGALQSALEDQRRARAQKEGAAARRRDDAAQRAAALERQRATAGLAARGHRHDGTRAQYSAEAGEEASSGSDLDEKHAPPAVKAGTSGTSSSSSSSMDQRLAARRINGTTAAGGADPPIRRSPV